MLHRRRFLTACLGVPLAIPLLGSAADSLPPVAPRWHPARAYDPRGDAGILQTAVRDAGLSRDRFAALLSWVNPPCASRRLPALAGAADGLYRWHSLPGQSVQQETYTLTTAAEVSLLAAGFARGHLEGDRLTVCHVSWHPVFGTDLPHGTAQACVCLSPRGYDFIIRRPVP